jgi:hypothetical protein
MGETCQLLDDRWLAWEDMLVVAGSMILVQWLSIRRSTKCKSLKIGRNSTFQPLGKLFPTLEINQSINLLALE